MLQQIITPVQLTPRKNSLSKVSITCEHFYGLIWGLDAYLGKEISVSLKKTGYAKCTKITVGGDGVGWGGGRSLCDSEELGVYN